MKKLVESYEVLVGLFDGAIMGKFVLGVFVSLIVGALVGFVELGVLVGILLLCVLVGLIDGVLVGTEVVGVPDGANVGLWFGNIGEAIGVEVSLSKSYISTKLISQYASVNSDGF